MLRCADWRGASHLPGTDCFLDSFAVVEMERSLGLTPSGQTLSAAESKPLLACTQDVQRKTPLVDRDRSLTSLIHSPSEFLDFSPAPSLEQTENKNVEEMTAEQSTPLDTFEGTKVNQDPSLLPCIHPDMQQPLNYTDAGNLRQKLASDNATLGRERQRQRGGDRRRKRG